MALTHAILAMLTNSPATGYELAKKFNEDLGTFWKSAQQQVYRDLGKLEEQGLISYEIVPRDGYLDKKLYSITASGECFLAAWISRPSDPAVLREDLVVKILAGHLVVPAVLREEIQRHQRIHAEMLSKYQAFIDCHYYDSAQLTWEAKLQRLAILRGIRYAKDWVAWCDEALAEIENH